MVTTIALLAGLIVLLLLASMLVRRPTTGSWHDIEAPVRVPRGSTASVRIGIEIQGPATWVRCTGTQTRRVAPVVEWPISTRRRGLQLVGPTALEFANPFGLGRRTLATRESSRVLVVPKISPAPVWLPTHGHATADGSERQGSELFDSLRAYASGDPMNSVHWRSSARTGQLMVRRMVETTVPSLMVVLDVEAAAYDRTRSGFRDFDPDSFEAAVDLAASWCAANTTVEQRVLLTTTAPDAPVVEVTSRNRHSAEDWLALVQPADRTLPERLAALAHRHGAGRLVAITGTHADHAWLATPPFQGIEHRVIRA